MKRLAVFAHYEATGTLPGYVQHHLRALRSVASRLVSVSNAHLSQHAREQVCELADALIERENLGFDFAMWRDALAREQLSTWDEVVLTNSSVLGPFRALPFLFELMAARSADYWGVTESTEGAWHLQSYFLVFRRSALAHPAFSRFWSGVLDYRDKQQVIRSYELGLSAYLREQGLVASVLLPLEQLAPWLLRSRWWRRDRRSDLRAASVVGNYGAELLALGAPYLKLCALRELRERTQVAALLARAQEAGIAPEVVRDLMSLATRPMSG